MFYEDMEQKNKCKKLIKRFLKAWVLYEGTYYNFVDFANDLKSLSITQILKDYDIEEIEENTKLLEDDTEEYIEPSKRNPKYDNWKEHLLTNKELL